MKRYNASPETWKSWRSCSFVLGLAIVLAGCSGGGRTTKITSEPSNAFIKVDGQNVGSTPVSFPFDLEKITMYPVSAEKQGFRTVTVAVRKGDGKIRRGNLHLVLQEDPAWSETTSSEATNRWLRLQVDPAIDAADAWQKIVDSVTTAYDTLEQMDFQSGYIRSVWQSRSFAGGPKEGPFSIKTQFVGTISSKKPLTYKFRISSRKYLDRESREKWEEYPRVFRINAELVEELQLRLGLK